jgi:hypothetical protein
MVAFTNLAFSASHLGTKYLNKIFAIHRGQYDELGILMITAEIKERIGHKMANVI